MLTNTGTVTSMLTRPWYIGVAQSNLRDGAGDFIMLLIIVISVNESVIGRATATDYMVPLKADFKQDLARRSVRGRRVARAVGRLCSWKRLG